MHVTAQTQVRTGRFGSRQATVFLPDGTARSWYGQDWPDPAELEVLRKSRLRSGARVFDCGAHQGVVALMLSQEVGPTGEIIAVEAEARNAEAAERNRFKNREGNITIINAAVSSEIGVIKFTHDTNGRIGPDNVWPGAWIEVPAITLDSLAEQFGHPDVVFVDIEGAEFKALGAASRIFNGPPTDFFVEVHSGCGLEIVGGTPAGVFGFFDPARYKILVRKDTEPFHEMRPDDVNLAQHFFIIAIDRRSL